MSYHSVLCLRVIVSLIMHSLYLYSLPIFTGCNSTRKFIVIERTRYISEDQNGSCDRECTYAVSTK